MKRTAYFLAIVTSALAFTTCDKVKFPHSIEDGGPPPPQEVAQKVVLEDYTGQGCGSCPGAAVVARQLEASYGSTHPSQFIVITVHAGYWSDTSSLGGNTFPTTFSTPAGEAYNDEWTIDILGNPKGMINRTEYQGNIAMNKDSWGSAIGELIDNEAPAKLDLYTDFDANTGEITIDAAYEFLTHLNGTYNLVLMLTETDIYDWQKNYQNTGDPQYPVGDVQNYKHEHVLRDNISGTWGDVIASGDISAGTNGMQSFSYTLDPSFIPDNCSIVAMITDANTKTILQAEETSVIQ